MKTTHFWDFIKTKQINNRRGEDDDKHLCKLDRKKGKFLPDNKRTYFLLYIGMYKTVKRLFYIRTGFNVILVFSI